MEHFSLAELEVIELTLQHRVDTLNKQIELYACSRTLSKFGKSTELELAITLSSLEKVKAVSNEMLNQIVKM